MDSVAEPKNNGTPYWHILSFAEKHPIEDVKCVISHYSLEEGVMKKGQHKTVVMLNSLTLKKASATSYIAK
jgi:hypothetical protein